VSLLFIKGRAIRNLDWLNCPSKLLTKLLLLRRLNVSPSPVGRAVNISPAYPPLVSVPPSTLCFWSFFPSSFGPLPSPSPPPAIRASNSAHSAGLPVTGAFVSWLGSSDEGGEGRNEEGNECLDHIGMQIGSKQWWTVEQKAKEALTDFGNAF
jgi:hypothetical protein